MSLIQILEKLSATILAIQTDHPLRVGIDGVDAAGKTHLANELVPYLEASGRCVIRASIDGFHNPGKVRRRGGTYSSDGYYFDSFNYQLLKERLLIPLGPNGNREYSAKVFDFRSDQEAQSEIFHANKNDILVFDGVFLFRPEIHEHWDFKVFVDVDFETVIHRVTMRDGYLFGEKEEILNRYNQRYIPGQKIYLESVHPRSKADIVINNNNIDLPSIIHP